eukprot:CAMPEP_0113567948 /NCGR_PEP_ID=MMETSP0015_2-20120614/23563_1 /TAXON_ID=2838 /ORGANISM="Odontella" /LENGTH=629 /DNA_ID=CAMNT_0000470407 /DNA_START=216 /DNA_END=2105 /DNA_ORIENTATION=- /assembly_acc=CAM_ASM_000160
MANFDDKKGVSSASGAGSTDDEAAGRVAETHRTEAHHTLAARLNNAAALRHRLGDYEGALELYQESIHARMEAISCDGSLRAGSPRQQRQTSLPSSSNEAKLLEYALERCRVVQKEEQMLRKAAAASAQQQPACLDMYPRPGSSRAAGDDTPLETALFFSTADPIEIPLREDTIHQRGANDAVDSSVTLRNMGLSHHLAGRISADKASKLFDMSLQTYASSSSSGSGTDDFMLLAETLHLSARSQIGLGNLRGASDALKRALHLWRKATISETVASSATPSSNSLDETSSPSQVGTPLELGAADGLSLLGRVRFLAGDLEGSLKMAREALGLRRSALGDHHVIVAATLYNIGVALRELGRTDEATEHVRWFVNHPEISIETKYRPHLADALHTLGLLCLERTETTAAVEIFTRCVEVRRGAHGTAQQSLVGDVLQLGRVLHDIGRYEDAMIQYRSALVIERGLARQQKHYKDTQQPLPQGEEPLLQREQNQEEGLALLQPGESEGLAAVLCSVAQVHQALGEHSQALLCYLDVLRIACSLFGPDDKFVMSLLSTIGNLRLETGDTRGALEDFAESERILRRVAHRASEEGARRRPQQEGSADGDSGPVIVVLSLLQGTGVNFHLHAAAA